VRKSTVMAEPDHDIHGMRRPGRPNKKAASMSTHFMKRGKDCVSSEVYRAQKSARRHAQRQM
jgi:hypothetical protein